MKIFHKRGESGGLRGKVKAIFAEFYSTIRGFFQKYHISDLFYNSQFVTYRNMALDFFLLEHSLHIPLNKTHLQLCLTIFCVTHELNILSVAHC